MSKFGDDIRRISRYQELKDLITQSVSGVDQTTKGAINGSRGIAYNSNGALIGGSGASGTSKPDGGNDTGTTTKDTGKKDGDSKKTDSGDSTNSGGSSDANNGDNTARDGWFDIDSLLQAAKDALGKSPPPAGSELRIDSVTGLKTDSDEAIIAHLKDALTSFLGPSDRDSAFATETDPDYTPGIFYSCDYPTAGTGYANYSADAVKDYAKGQFSLSVDPSHLPLVDVGWDPAPSASHTTGAWKFHYSDEPTTIRQVNVYYRLCASDALATITACPISEPLLFWTYMGFTQVAWVSVDSAKAGVMKYNDIGKFMPNPNDSSVPSSLTSGASILDLVATGSGDPVRIGPLAGGGWYAYYRDTGAGNAPVGDANTPSVLMINPDRTSNGFITPNALDKMLPQ